MIKTKKNDKFLGECGLGTAKELQLTDAIITEFKKEAFGELCKTKIKDFITDDELKGFEKAKQYRVGATTFDRIDDLYRCIEN